MHSKTVMVPPGEALPGREQPVSVPDHHVVPGTPLTGQWPEGSSQAMFGMGCFWGAERLFWQREGVYSTAAGYSGGYTPNPTYREVCSGGTGHAEVVLVVYVTPRTTTSSTWRRILVGTATTASAKSGTTRASRTTSASSDCPVAESSTAARPGTAEPDPGGDNMTRSVELTDHQWRARLTGEQYRILREAGTERAFTGAYWDNKDTGTYRCAACHTPLFSSDSKYDSRTGWPSFWDAVDPSRVERREDRSHGTVRTEVVCRTCGGHLGHIFPDGPEPTGDRYCINSAALMFSPENTASS